MKLGLGCEGRVKVRVVGKAGPRPSNGRLPLGQLQYGHLDLLGHEAVYAQIKAWLG